MTTQSEDVVECSFPSHPRFLPVLRGLVERAAEIAGFGGDDCDQIVLAVTEGVTNVMRHGYNGDTTRRIDVRLHAPAGGFRLDIRDYGVFVDPETIRSRDLADVRPGGLGVHLMKSTMDAVTYSRNDHGGTTLTLQKWLGGNPPTEEER